MNKRQAEKAAYWTTEKRYRRPSDTRIYESQLILLRRGFSWDMLTHKWKPRKR